MTKMRGRTSIYHGISRVPEYKVWKAMKSRCQNSRDPAWDRYGGRGITVCPRWERFFEFIADMKARPTRRHTLDRLDNNGGYNPDNCAWRTYAEQGSNKRNNRMIEYKGVTKTLTGWAHEFGLNSGHLHERLRKGWSLENAFSTADFRKWNLRNDKPDLTAGGY